LALVAAMVRVGFGDDISTIVGVKGLGNPDTLCPFNAVIHLVMNTPSWRAACKQAARTDLQDGVMGQMEAVISELERRRSPGYQHGLPPYVSAVPSIDTQCVRQAFSAVSCRHAPCPQCRASESVLEGSMGYISSHPPTTVVVEVDRVQYDKLNPTSRAVKREDKVELPPDGVLEVPFVTENHRSVCLRYCLGKRPLWVRLRLHRSHQDALTRTLAGTSCHSRIHRSVEARTPVLDNDIAVFCDSESAYSVVGPEAARRMVAAGVATTRQSGPTDPPALMTRCWLGDWCGTSSCSASKHLPSSFLLVR